MDTPEVDIAIVELLASYIPFEIELIRISYSDVKPTRSKVVLPLAFVIRRMVGDTDTSSSEAMDAPVIIQFL